MTVNSIELICIYRIVTSLHKERKCVILSLTDIDLLSIIIVQDLVEKF